MDERQGPEDWIGREVMVTLNEADPSIKHQKGFLSDFNQAGVTVLLSPTVPGRGGPVPVTDPQYVFYPWHRVMVVARRAEDIEPRD